MDLYDEIERLRAETGPGGARKIVVRKKRADGSGWDRCRQFASSELERLDVIPEMFGGGEFQLQLIDAANRYLKAFLVSWSPDLYPAPRAVRPSEPGASASPAAGAPPASGDRLTEIFMLMQRQAQEQQERYVALLQSIMTSLIGSRAAGGVKERVEELVALRSLVQENPKAPIDLLKEVLLTGLQLGKGGEAGAGAGDEDEEGEGKGMVRVIERGLDLFDKVLQRSGPARSGAAAPAGPRPVPQLPEQLQPYAWLLKYVPDAIEQFARMPAGDRRTLLTQLDPRLGPYQVFLDELAAQLVVIFDKEAEDDAPDNPGAAESA